jgi:uncharacterized protein
MKKPARLALFAAILLLPLHSYAASFNCTKAKTWSEKTICSTKQLSNLDELLAASFSKALASTRDKASLKAEQLDWLTDERDVCHDVACLKSAYTDRIATLNEAIADAEVTDPDPIGWHEVTAQPSLVVRDKPSVTGNKIGTVPHGGKINVLEATGKTDNIGGRSGTWVKVQWQSKQGYAFDAFLDKLSTEKADTSDAPPPKTEKPATKPVKTSGGKRLQGVISSYDCGDNCYLTITDAKGADHIGLCSAPTCDSWNEVAEMPASFKNKPVEVVIGKGTQYDGGGNVMGEMDAFEEVIFLE